MSLTSSLLIGRTALNASQAAIQVTGNNMANAATPGYHRQRVEMGPLRGQRQGLSFAGRGVEITRISRAIDPALTARFRGALAQENASAVERQVLSSLEAMMNELTDADLSSQMGRFFNAWSELANNPGSSVTRSAVVEEGANLAGFINGLRSDLVQQRGQIERQIAFNVDRANTLLTEIAGLNQAIVNAEQGNAVEGNLRDQRGMLLDELAGMLDVTVIEQQSGAVDVLVDSFPIVLGSTARGMELDVRSVEPNPQLNEPGGIEYRIMSKLDQEEIRLTSGTLGGLLQQRDGSIQRTIDELDSVAATLAFEVNRLHTSGRPVNGLTDITSSQSLEPSEWALSLNDPTNETLALLPFAPRNGSFQVQVTDENGNTFDQTIFVDLDGIDSAGATGFGDDTTLDDLRASIDAVPNLNAEITPTGSLRVFTDAGYEVSFSDDSSGVLAVLGINTFFTGSDAGDLAVAGALRADPERISVGSGPGENDTALAIAQLRDTPISRFPRFMNGGQASSGDVTLQDLWGSTVERNAVLARSADTRYESLSAVRQSLEAQDRAIGGVSMDEESINLIQYQQQYQGAARFISVVDELTQLLLSLV
jgi:flagellar hook-associated protein 1 FlgK